MSNSSNNQSWVVAILVAIIDASGFIVAAMINKSPTDKPLETVGSDQNNLPSSVISEPSPKQPIAPESEIRPLE